MQNYLELKDRVALVTGASSGIGAATAVVLADLGAKIAIGYHRNEAGAESVRAGIVAAGGGAITIRADMRRSDEITYFVKRASDEMGPIDILVNNVRYLI